MVEQHAVEPSAQDALSTIVGFSDDVQAYRRSMDELAGRRESRRRKTAAMIGEMEHLVDDQQRRLQEAIDRHGVRDAGLYSRVVESLGFMHRTREKLRELGASCSEEVDADLSERVCEAVEAVREQIAYALDIRFAK